MLVVKECNLNHDFPQGDITLSVLFRNPLISRRCLIIVMSKTSNLCHAENCLAGTGNLNFFTLFFEDMTEIVERTETWPAKLI